MSYKIATSTGMCVYMLFCFYVNPFYRYGGLHTPIFFNVLHQWNNPIFHNILSHIHFHFFGFILLLSIFFFFFWFLIYLFFCLLCCFKISSFGYWILSYLKWKIIANFIQLKHLMANCQWYSDWWFIKAYSHWMHFGYDILKCHKSFRQWRGQLINRCFSIWNLSPIEMHTYAIQWHATWNSKCFTTLSMLFVSMASKSFDVEWYQILYSCINGFIVTNQCQWNVLLTISRRS